MIYRSRRSDQVSELHICKDIQIRYNDSIFILYHIIVNYSTIFNNLNQAHRTLCKASLKKVQILFARFMEEVRESVVNIVSYIAPPVILALNDKEVKVAL